MAIAILLAGTLLPALSGVLFWMRRQSPERMRAADQLTRGRVLSRAVSISLVDGVIVWIAWLVMMLLTHVMVARALEDPELVSSSNIVFTIVALVGAIGVWGLIARRQAGARGSVAP